MAKHRIVNTKFWDDSYVARMSPNEKLVFLYLLTNPLTTIAGVYELSTKRASFDTGLSAREIGKVLGKLEEGKKIIRDGDWIGIVNFIRHQSLNPKVRRGIEIELEKAPVSLVGQLDVDFASPSQPMDRLSHSNPKLNYNSNLNSNLKSLSKERFSTAYPQDVERMKKRLIRKMHFGS